MTIYITDISEIGTVYLQENKKSWKSENGLQPE